MIRELPLVIAGAVPFGYVTLEKNAPYCIKLFDKLGTHADLFEDFNQFARFFEARKKPSKPDPKDYVRNIFYPEQNLSVLQDYTMDVLDWEERIKIYHEFYRRSELIKGLFHNKNNYLDFVLTVFHDIDRVTLQKMPDYKPLLMDIYKYQKFPVHLLPETFTRHVFITGATGSGKTNTLKNLVWGLLENRFHQNKKYATKTATIIFDPHGKMLPIDERDYYENNFSRNIASFPFFDKGEDNLIIIDPIMFDGFSPCLSPFERPDNFDNEVVLGNMSDQLLQVLKQIIRGVSEADSSASIFTMPMIGFLKPVLNLLLHHEETDLSDLALMFQPAPTLKKDKRYQELRDYAILNLPDEVHREWFQTEQIFTINESTRETLYARFYTIATDPTIRRFFSGKSSFDLKQAIECGKTIIFSFQRGNISPAVISAIGQFINYQLLAHVFSRKDQSVRVNFIMDECKFFLSETTIEMLTEVRKYNLSLIMATQQLAGIYAPIRESILSNTGTQMAGKNKRETAKSMASSLSLSESDIQDLSIGQYYSKFLFGQKESAVLKVEIPEIKGEKYFMPYSRYLEIIEQQKQKYYREIVVKYPKNKQENSGSQKTRTPKKQQFD